jgi:hypothetical protein
MGQRARSTADWDLVYALCVEGCLLVSPVTWDHTLLLLVLPLAIAWPRIKESRPARIAAVFFVMVIAFEPTLLWRIFLGPGWPSAVAGPKDSLLVLSLPFYALSGLFVETGLVAGRPPSA